MDRAEDVRQRFDPMGDDVRQPIFHQDRITDADRREVVVEPDCDVTPCAVRKHGDLRVGLVALPASRGWYRQYRVTSR